MISFEWSTTNWEAVAAIGTILSAVVALGIAVFTHNRSVNRDKRSHEKEAVEKLLVPIRKGLDSFSKIKWDNWEFRNRCHSLKNLKLDFPLQYYWLDQASSQLVVSIENFDQKFERLDHLREQTKAPEVTRKSVASSVQGFFNENNISITGNAGKLPGDDAILNSHWSCSVGGKTGGAVTLYSLVMWKTTLSQYLDARKQDEEIANKKVDYTHYSMSDLTFSPTLNGAERVDKLLAQIEKDISEHEKKDEINDYREKWQDLYNSGSALINKIDSWLSKE